MAGGDCLTLGQILNPPAVVESGREDRRGFSYEDLTHMCDGNHT